MEGVTFPKRREDGSFTVRARCSMSDPDKVQLVGAFVDAWVRANRTWTRIWRSNVIEEEHLNIANEFATDPHVERGSTDTEFAIVFDGLPSSKLWKDWMVYLMQEVTTAFPEVRFDRFDS